jgi:hypothetical protein
MIDLKAAYIIFNKSTFKRTFCSFLKWALKARIMNNIILDKKKFFK